MFHIEKKGLGAHHETHEEGGSDEIDITTYITIINNITQIAIEGDYSEWTLKWESDPLAEFDTYLVRQSGFISDETIALMIGYSSALAVINIAAETVIENAGFSGDESPQFSDRSIFGKYYAFISYPNTTIRIYKDGVLTKTIAIEAGLDEFEGLAMSPSGKYIITLYEDDSEAAADEFTFKIYEGS